MVPSTFTEPRVYFRRQTALQGVLDELIAMFEPVYAKQWARPQATTYRQRMLGHIVGFEIHRYEDRKPNSSSARTVPRASRRM